MTIKYLELHISHLESWNNEALMALRNKDWENAKIALAEIEKFTEGLKQYCVDMQFEMEAKA